jgi:Na+/melibiose symporter-like transporter
MKKWEYISINAYWFGLAFMWNGLHPIILPALLLPIVPDSFKNTYLGGMTFIGLILAMVIQPLAGAFSDETRSRWGRRRPWIFGGTIFTLVFLTLMAMAGGFWGLLVAYLLLQIASNTAHGPAQGLIPDLVPGKRRGLASGIKNLFEMGGLIIASLVAGQLMGKGNSYKTFFVIIVVLAISALITILFTTEKSTADLEKSSHRSSIRKSFRLNLRQYPEYTRLLISRYFILLGIYVVQSFAQYYIQDWLNVENPAQVTGNLMATIGLSLTILVFPAGILSDRIGRKRMNIFAGALASVGILLLLSVQGITTLYVVGGIIGMATGIFLSVNWAWATDLIPLDEAGKYLGISNLATAGAAATSRLAGPVIDTINIMIPGSYLGYPTLFIIAAAFTSLGTLLLLRIQERNPASKND